MPPLGDRTAFKMDRYVEFIGADGKPRVIAKTIWAIIDRATMRAIRVPLEVVRPFLRADQLHGTPA